MADTGKSVRVARTQFAGKLAQSGVPTERSQLVGQEVHQYRDTESDALYALNDSISRFMGAGVNALASVQEGYQRGKLAEIEQQNKAQKQQALGDALAGKEMDPDLVGDDDYYSAFRSVRAQRDGFDAAQDFTEWYMSEWLPGNPTGDLAAARQQWALENLMGSDDPDYEGQLIASFFDRTDGLLPEHMKAAIKYQTDRGIEALGQLVEADVASGSITPEKLTDYFNKARTLDPLNAAEAPTRVVNALLVAANNHPEKMLAVAKMLSQEGTGVNGRSFAQSFPDAYASFQTSAVAAYNEINSAAELESFTSLQDRIREAKSAEDLKSVTVDALKHRQQFGNPGRINTLLDQIDTALGYVAKDLDLAASTMSWIGGDRSVDPSDVRKGFPKMLEQMGLATILDAEPKQAAQILNGMGGLVPEEASAVLTAAILDTRSPEMQARAIETLNILSATTGKEAASAYLSSAAKNLYDHAYTIQAASPHEPLDAILARVNEARDKVKDWDVTWQKITKEPDAKAADTRVNDVVKAQLNDRLGTGGWFQAEVILPLDLTSTVLERARLKAIEFEASGLGWEAGVRSAVDQVVSNYDLLPVANGKTRLTPNAARNSQYVNDDGQFDTRIRMGREVINPVTGRPVDTIAVFEQAKQGLRRAFPALLPGGNPDHIYLNEPMNPDMKARGMFDVRGPDAMPLTFAAGDTVTLQSKDSTVAPMAVAAMGVVGSVRLAPNTPSQAVTIPANAAEMSKLFDLPEGFGWVRVDTPAGVVWQMGYRPNFGDQAGKTLDEQEAAFQSTPAPVEPPQPPAPVGLPMGIIDPVYTQ
ncbi:hypothetical protein SAMN02983003_0619 [Devosia enhydra]|uniref:Uncharacterized protein n=1 Tax=Devosia enhydra TaxID=665118 RepID=A0A1K2HTU7_9HYPH|nr:hypothetical protein [Devosia enhydra]SFZ81658.1 hypothetical protein SAMN02983003_0619 [Devosia enhydra]